MKENDEKKYTGHRRGGPGGEGCRLSVLPITAKRPDGMQFDAQLLDAGSESTEVELLRTIADLVRSPARRHRQYIPGEGEPSKEEAEAMVAEMEARGHRQTYWCRDDLIT